MTSYTSFARHKNPSKISDKVTSVEVEYHARLHGQITYCRLASILRFVLSLGVFLSPRCAYMLYSWNFKIWSIKYKYQLVFVPIPIKFNI